MKRLILIPLAVGALVLNACGTADKHSADAAATPTAPTAAPAPATTGHAVDVAFALALYRSGFDDKLTDSTGVFDSITAAANDHDMDAIAHAAHDGVDTFDDLINTAEGVDGVDGHLGQHTLDVLRECRAALSALGTAADDYDLDALSDAGDDIGVCGNDSGDLANEYRDLT